jgi:hypothetical protein
MHTTASDGDYPPAALITLAHARGLTTIAITDHDTTDGIPPAQDAAAQHNITVIPAIELSAETEKDGDVHMLGYYIDITNADLQARLGAFRENRAHRARKMLAKLHELGVPLAWEAVEAAADGAPITRPHLARAMVTAGYVDSLQAAFDQYLASDAPAYVSRTRMSPEEAVDLVHSAGGAAVLAHPGLVKHYEPVLRRLIAHGVDGVEVVHPKNPPGVSAHVREIAEAHDLIMTGGSDFHRPERADGSITLGEYNPPPGAVERLRARAKHQN